MNMRRWCWDLWKYRKPVILAVLDHFRIRFNPLIGGTGAGKSTIMEICVEYEAPSEKTR